MANVLDTAKKNHGHQRTVADVASRMKTRVQISTDGLRGLCKGD